MQNNLALLGALIGAVVLSILVGLLRRDAQGKLRPADLLAAAAAGAIMGGLIAYAAVPAPNPLVPAPVEDAAVAPTPPEAAMEPAVGTPQIVPSATTAPDSTDAPKVAPKHAAVKAQHKNVAAKAPVNVPPAAGGAGTCREYSTKIMIEGRLQDAYGTTCQQPDGTWQKTL